MIFLFQRIMKASFLPARHLMRWVSVSYTHLDVYKRQFICRVVELEQEKLEVQRKNAGCIFFFLHSAEPVPVSYTHLWQDQKNDRDHTVHIQTDTYTDQ